MTAARIAIIGGGIGGISAAIALRAVGVDATVYEQAPAFGRIGAAINMTPNAVKVLDRLGVGEAVRETAWRPTHRVSRTWDTGEETSRLPMSGCTYRRASARSRRTSSRRTSRSTQA